MKKLAFLAPLALLMACSATPSVTAPIETGVGVVTAPLEVVPQLEKDCAAGKQSACTTLAAARAACLNMAKDPQTMLACSMAGLPVTTPTPTATPTPVAK